jgi:hypothetical protein
MTPVKTTPERSRISDRDVKKGTGHTWAEWYTLLDKEGAKKMSHQEIVAYLRAHYEFGGWWFQMVTVAYEQGRGRKPIYEKPSGSFDISKSKIVDVSVAKAYAAWRDNRLRKVWLNTGELVVRTATRNKSFRVTWSDKKTNLNVNFYPKGKTRCQVVVQHCRLTSEKAAEKKKEYWHDALLSLKSYLEK